MWRLFLNICHLHIDNYGHIVHKVAFDFKECHLHIDNYGHIVHKVAFDFKELWTVAGECRLLLILEKERANWILNRKALWLFLQCKGRHLTKRNSSFLRFWRELFRKYNHQIWNFWSSSVHNQQFTERILG